MRLTEPKGVTTLTKRISFYNCTSFKRSFFHRISKLLQYFNRILLFFNSIKLYTELLLRLNGLCYTSKNINSLLSIYSKKYVSIILTQGGLHNQKRMKYSSFVAIKYLIIYYIENILGLSIFKKLFLLRLKFKISINSDSSVTASMG